jgi:PBP1b-binding outer membrane lipoprotein LpoB
MMKPLRRLTLICIVLAALFCSGCRSSNPETYHVNEDVDFSFVKKVAVMPLENLTSDKSAGEIVRHLVISEMLASGLSDVVVPGEVIHAVNDLGIKNISSLSKKQIIALGRTLRVQALIMGSVQQYGLIRLANISAPEVTITLMMADTGTGDIIWSVTKTRGGASFMARHFGTKSETISEAVLATVREAIETLVAY